MKRRVTCFLAIALVVFIGHPVKADQAAANDFAGQIMSGYNGRVGIGTREPVATLDVYQGEVKIGSSGAACTAALAGTLRYADAKLQLCDGAGWRKVSLDKAE